ncbi:uncharacterized protein LOC123310249 [Coccinella septempunctata]|uniref:uncharacterized protein LOC123310249 n=1 Tax=Coccinella septempunctata TaxID=41139 RepID=UPI001D06C766|nr:uncharacterized protein LOC123310249 [Coccinella septempunctata]
MRVHFIAKELQGTTNRTYREILTTTWNEINPSKLSYPNLLSNRVRWILQEEKFSSVELEEIKRSTRPFAPPPKNETRNSEELPPEPQIPIRPQVGKTERMFHKNKLMYTKVPPELRPKIPRLQGSRRIIESVEKVNAIIKSEIKYNSTLEDVLDYVYAGAITVCEENDIRINHTQPKPAENRTPPWKIRLEGKITNIRKKIGKIHTYLNTSSPTRKMAKKIAQIASEHHIRNTNEQFKEQLTVVHDILKQKAKALGNRIKRYNERVTRYKNNQLYYKNQKQFYRQLEGIKKTEEEFPTPESMHKTWEKIWSSSGEHNDEASWIREAEAESDKYNMEQINITENDIKTALKKTNNWSAPGPDAVHNYWWKYFDSTHKRLAEIFQRALTDPTCIPETCTLGISHMIPKGAKNGDPTNYRPITCLPVIYKILTGIVTQKIWDHVAKNSILAREQNGCRRDVKGCKELLIIDSLITKQAKKKLRSLSMAWIDYKKAFDSIPHSWLLKTLELYGVSEAVVNLLKHLMGTWRTKLHVNTNEGDYTTAEIKIKRGLFQGDKLSTLWFCLAINHLSILLNKSRYGYIVEKRNNIKINHQLYIDDLKLYAANEDQLLRQLKIVAYFTETIKMEMGLDKCAVLHMKRGKLISGEAMTLCEEDNNITALNLASRNLPAEPPNISELSEIWHGKALHGRYPNALKRNRIDKERSVKYLKAGYLFPETEGRQMSEVFTGGGDDTARHVVLPNPCS